MDSRDLVPASDLAGPEPAGYEPDDALPSTDPAVAAVIAALAGYDPDLFLATDDADLADTWCEAMAGDLGIPFACVTDVDAGEHRCGPARLIDGLVATCDRTTGGIELYPAGPVTDHTVPGLAEALIARRDRLTRLQVKRKRLTSMDAKRRGTAARAKRWRAVNKSRKRSYARDYRDPHTGG